MNILDFSKKACFILEETTDHNALRKLCSYLVTQIEELSAYQIKHAELSIVNNRMKLAQEILEKELIDYKLKFEDLSKKIDEYGYVKSPSVRRFEKKEEIEFEYPISKLPQEANESFSTDPINDEFPVDNLPTFETMATMLSADINQNFASYLVLDKNWKFIKDFQKHAPFIKSFASSFIKKDSFNEGLQLPSTSIKVPELKGELIFEHVLPENGDESILHFTLKTNKLEYKYHLVPQLVVEQIIKLPESKAVKYNQLILKNIKEISESSTLKIGVKKYWLLEIVQDISKVKDEFLMKFNPNKGK